MTTTTITTKCPEWCESNHRMEIGDHGHNGPAWPSEPIKNGALVTRTFAGMNTKGQMIVYGDEGEVHLTPEEAIQAGNYLIEAGQWALAHQVA